MTRIKLQKYETCDSHSETGITKPGFRSMELKILSGQHFSCESHPIDSKPSVVLPENLDTSILSQFKPKIPSTSLDEYGDVIGQFKDLRVTQQTPSDENKELDFENRPTSTVENVENSRTNCSGISECVFNFSPYATNCQFNIPFEKKENDDKAMRKCDNEHLHERSDIEDDSDKNLIERGPIRPQIGNIRNKPYSTLDWLLRFDGYPHQESYDVLQSETSDYENNIQQLLTDSNYKERLDFDLDKLSNIKQESRMHNERNTLKMFEGKDSSDNRRFSADSSDEIPQSIVIRNPEETSLLKILARGGFQAAQVYVEGGQVNGHSPEVNSERWSDSPESSYNVVNSRPNSRSSSRAHSPGLKVISCNAPGSPKKSSQASSNHQIRRGLSSSSSSNQSCYDTSSPGNYQTPLGSHTETQLEDEFRIFMSCHENCQTSSNIVRAENGEILDALDSSELRLVEEVVLKELNEKTDEVDETQFNLRTRFIHENFDSTNRNSRFPLDYKQRIGSEETNERNETNEDSLNQSINFGNIISEAQRSLVSSRIEDGFDLLYSRNSSSHPKERTTHSNSNYVENTPLGSDHIDKASIISQKIETSLQNIITKYSKNKINHKIDKEMSVPGFDLGLIECTKNTHNEDDKTAKIENPGCSDFQKVVSSTFNEFQVPEIVKRPSYRRMAPWSSLNLPPTKATDKLIRELNPKDVERAMSHLLKKSAEDLIRVDEDGDTILMRLVGNQNELMKKKAYLLPLVERVSTIRGALTITNNQGKDALYLTAINCPQMPHMTGYLAATMLHKRIQINKQLYQPNGDTLIHALVREGDSHRGVLEEVLALKNHKENAAFDVSASNDQGKTALHLAVELHDPHRKSSLSMVQLLLKNGADTSIREKIQGDTVLHSAVSMSDDPILLEILVRATSRNALNLKNYHGNTPLHLAAMANNLSVERQIEICEILISHGAKTNTFNGIGRTPVEFIHPARRHIICQIFHERS